jgi:hypothetical protein
MLSIGIGISAVRFRTLLHKFEHSRIGRLGDGDNSVRAPQEPGVIPKPSVFSSGARDLPKMHL